MGNPPPPPRSGSGSSSFVPEAKDEATDADTADLASSKLGGEEDSDDDIDMPESDDVWGTIQ